MMLIQPAVDRQTDFCRGKVDAGQHNMCNQCAVDLKLLTYQAEAAK
jgi:hypothetical protein